MVVFEVESWRARLRNDMGYQLLYRTAPAWAGTPQVELELLLAPGRVLTISGWLAGGLNLDQANSISHHHLRLANTTYTANPP